MSRTVGDVAQLPEDVLVVRAGRVARRAPRTARAQRRRARGDARARDQVDRERRDVRHRRRATVTRSSARSCGSPIASPVGCAHAGVEARTVTLKVRFADFRTITRSRTEPEATALSTDIAATARALLAPIDVSRRCPAARDLGFAARRRRRRARACSISGRRRPTSTTTSAPGAARSRTRSTRCGPASVPARSARGSLIGTALAGRENE